MLEFLRNLFTFDEWATNRSLGSLESVENSKARLMLSHVLIAEKIWLLRLRGEDSSHVRTFEEFSPAECAGMSSDLHKEYTEFLNSLAEADLETLITYRNSKGTEFQTSIKDILTHVALHGVYHRGQIALLVRENGGRAVDTDFIEFTRL